MEQKIDNSTPIDQLRYFYIISGVELPKDISRQTLANLILANEQATVEDIARLVRDEMVSPLELYSLAEKVLRLVDDNPVPLLTVLVALSEHTGHVRLELIDKIVDQLKTMTFSQVVKEQMVLGLSSFPVGFQEWLLDEIITGQMIYRQRLWGFDFGEPIDAKIKEKLQLLGCLTDEITNHYRSKYPHWFNE